MSTPMPPIVTTTGTTEAGVFIWNGHSWVRQSDPLPTDLAQPPALPLRRWAWARRFLRYARVSGTLRPGYRATQEPPLLNRRWGYDQLVASPLRATHIASATYRGLRGFERWVR